MARLENLQKAVEILENKNKECMEHCNKNLYTDFEVDENDLIIILHNILFFSEIKNMDYLYIRPMDYELQIQF